MSRPLLELATMAATVMSIANRSNIIASWIKGYNRLERMHPYVFATLCIPHLF